MSARVVVTGSGAICAAGKFPVEIWDAVWNGRPAIRRIQQWDTSGWPTCLAGEIAGLDPRALVEDRKVHRLVQRSDLLGLYAAGRALDDSGFVAYRESLEPSAVATVNDRTGVYVGLGGGGYQNEYEFFPLLTEANGDLGSFGRELAATVNPMWLLRSMPNNVLCHIGIRHGLKGPNACLTNHCVSGSLAVVEAAAALLLETETAAAARHARVFGEFLGSGCTTEAEGLLTIRADGDGRAGAMTLALDDAGMRPAEVGMIVAHGNGTRQSDASEALAIRRVFGSTPPPVTAFKWAFGHPLAASGILDSVLALVARRHGVVPGVATLREPDPDLGNLPVSARPQAPRSDVALVLNRGFGGSN